MCTSGVESMMDLLEGSVRDRRLEDRVQAEVYQRLVFLSRDKLQLHEVEIGGDFVPVFSILDSSERGGRRAKPCEAPPQH